MIHVVDLQQGNAPKAVTDSLIEYGFAVIENHPVLIDELKLLYEVWDDFFQSSETANFTVDAVTQAGYFATSEAETAKGHQTQDLKEYFHHYPGGKLPNAVETITIKYSERMFELGKSVMIWLQANTPPDLWWAIDDPFESYLSEPKTLLRILRYPPLTGAEPPGSIRAAAHEDINLITMLPSASEPGLEIKPAGSDWMPIESPDGSIVINIGDMLQELTEGIMPSTTHRVINPAGDAAKVARLTAPVFCHPYPEMKLSNRYTAKTYLHERLSEINTANLKPS